MSQQAGCSIGGGGFFSMLFIVFLVLKLTDKIDWSWWWVTAPLWGPIAFGFAFLVVIVILAIAVDS